MCRPAPSNPLVHPAQPVCPSNVDRKHITRQHASMSKSTTFRAIGWICATSATITLLLSTLSVDLAESTEVPQVDTLPSSSVLALLPEGEEKRRFILDCTGCHQIDPARAFPGGASRSASEWSAIIDRMNSMAGATTGFPVISEYRDAEGTASWLSRYLRDASALRPVTIAPSITKGRAIVREYLVSQASDLPHDIAIDSSGRDGL